MITEQQLPSLFQMNELYLQNIKIEPYNYSPFRSLLQTTGNLFAPFMQENVRLCLLQPDENSGIMIITCLYASPGMKRIEGKALISDCFSFEELKKGDAIAIEDMAAYPGKSCCGWLVASADIRSELLCPVIAGERIICVLSLQRNIVYQWSKQEILDIHKVALSLYRHIRSYEHMAFRSYLLDAVNDAITVLNGNGCIDFWNIAAERLSGYSSFEAIGMPLEALLKLDQSSAAYIAGIKSLTESNYCAVEIGCCHKNGQRIYVEALGTVCRDEKGEVLETILSLRDITERHNMKLTLKQQADSLAQRDYLLELSSEAIFIWQLDGVITYWNGGAELLFGYQREEAIGQISYKLLQTRLPNTEEHIISVLHRDGCLFGEIEHTRKDGSTLLSETSQQVITNEDGQQLVLEINRDIATRKQADTLIRRQNTILTHINKIHVGSSAHTSAEELSDIFLEVIEEATGSQLSFIAEVNKDGSLRNIAIGMSKHSEYNIVPSWDYQQYTQSFYAHGLHQTVIQQGKALLVNTAEANFEGIEVPAGHPIIRRFLGVPFIFNGEVTGIVAAANKDADYTEDDKNMLEDLTPTIIRAMQKKLAETELKQSKQRAFELIERLRTANKSQNDFFNVLSHELRNPLATIVASLHLLDIAQDAGQMEKAKLIIKRQSEQLCRLTDDLLDHARIQNNKIQLKKTRIELKSLLLHTAEDYSTLFRQKGLRLITDMRLDSLYLYADPVRLEQLIGNLLDNALKYTSRSGNVTLSLIKGKSEALIQVKDNGRGIKSEALPRLFDPFMQEERFPEMKNNGLGLGLSIAMGIAQLHGGTIDAFSDGADKGSTFCVHLPLPALSAGATSKTASQSSNGRRLRILFVENNVDFSRMLSAMLQFAGHKTASAQNVTDGLNTARSFLPDVIFCNIELSSTNGFEFARHIRSEPLLQDVYLVAMAGSESENLITREMGFDAHICKPVDMAVVNKVLGEISPKT